jgi:formamidopyrimidine-DNA glycosylase
VPELIEVEAYRRLAEQALERKITEVTAADAWWLKGGLSADVLSDALVGRHFLAARRIGKRMMLDTSDHGPVLGLKFGMTGRLLVDGRVGVEKLEYSSNREVEAWDRLVVHFADGGDLRVRDARRLGGAELDPETQRLGPDAVGLNLAGLRKVLDDTELKGLHRALRRTLTNLTKRGGSHTGALQPARHRDGVCPLDGAPLLRRTIGGRTTFSCPVHQV